MSRREFLTASVAAFGSIVLSRSLSAASDGAEPIIDIHQHHRYRDRPDDNLLFHQKTLGITSTVLLPGGEETGNPPTLMSLNAPVLELLFGTDCTDQTARGPICIGARQIATIRRLAPSKSIERKLLYENASKLLRII